MKKKTNNKGISIVFILLFVALVIGGALYFSWKSLLPYSTTDTSNNIDTTPSLQTASPTPTPSPTPKPIFPLIPDNGSAGTYIVSQPAHAGPAFRQVVFDPLDAKKDQNLKITVSLNSKSSVQTLTGDFQMDSSQKSLTFKKVGNQGASETWEVEFQLTDSVDYKYILTLTAKDSEGTATMTVAPRS